ncbi:N-acetylmuramoyl-L-alanine amidase CwlD [Desulfotomaculum arcticum]|uniref:N-acetylmuramoyl-L-alanine amidase CwlD n=1 Tax=Desulfotruncus arcticus DSM 17038 TaxID=1121424 RepID=A0A1I2VQ45_9FIRM|nr:divergent polysaccharide deacetylase family protein [Desulfotruncus arcticus]SFG89606.1 N-acetylmuramoyl-L-alanine amidase CwlD [Desulfotomaculum arcticum] [Desulfotruncus arcticus DSM 17038]
MKRYRRCFLIMALIGCLLLTMHLDGSVKQNKPALAFNGVRGKTVVIDPGHGGRDLGCKAGKQVEKDINLKVAQNLAKMLKLEGAEVKLTRNGDYEPGRWFFKRKNELDARIAQAAKYEADIYVSLHVNASSKNSKAGAVVFHNDANYSAGDLAQNIQRELRRIPAMVKRTSHARNYYVLTHLDIPAVVVEMGYLSNTRDFKQLQNSRYQKEIAHAIGTGINNYFNRANPVKTAGDLPAQKEKYVGQAGENKPGAFFLPKNPSKLLMLSEEVEAGDESFEDKSLAEKARLSLKKLAEGPRNNSELSSCIPRGVNIQDVQVLGTLARVDLKIDNVNLDSIGSEEEWIALSSIAYTLFELPQLHSVKLTVNGAEVRTLARHMDISKPLDRNKMSLTRVAGGLMEGKKAKVAIVIDDFGSSDRHGVKEMMQIDRPLTFAVMPNLENTTAESKQAAQRGYEVIVHLPLQPLKGKASWLGPGAITSNMTPVEIREQAIKDFNQVPYATGFNNHTGSLITSREDLITPVLEAAKDRGFMVLDSKTSEGSKMLEIAQNMGIACTQRDVFLDDIKNVAKIKKQLNLLAEKALAQGSAVGIGHVGNGGDKTARAIKEMIPVMEARGIEFVYLSELVH